MNHIAYQPRGEDVELATDYVVVGSGAGGAAAAATLARAGAAVAVVEAGPWRDPEDYPHSVYGTMRDMFDVWSTTFTRGRAFWPVVQGMLVGGTTVINSAICVRTPADVFKRWQREHGVGGEQMAKAVWRIQDRLERELCVEEVPPRALGRSNRLAMKGANALGYRNHVMRRYVKDCKGDGHCLQGCRTRNKQSTNVTFIPEVLQRGGAVLSCAPADKVVFEGRRALGVRGRFRHPTTRKRGGRFFVRARKGVLVAASATHSPLLLMRSGVRSKALGKHFHAHPGTPVIGCYDDPVDMNRGATQGWASLAFRDDPGFKIETLSLPIDMLAGRIPGGGRQLMKRLSEFRHIAVWIQACRAESEGVVRRGLFGRPSVHYTLDTEDMVRFRQGMLTVAKTHFAAGARSVMPAIFGLPFEVGPDRLDLIERAPLDPRCYVAILSHLFGGCVMGADPARSVCDGNGRVHGYENLAIADASAIPTNLGVNPQHTIMALAQLWAERMVS